MGSHLGKVGGWEHTQGTNMDDKWGSGGVLWVANELGSLEGRAKEEARK